MRTTIAALTPASATLPAPSRGSDVFDFLHPTKKVVAPEECVTVQQDEASEVVVVKYTTPDGRSLHRKVPAESWQDESYRGGLIRSLALLVA